MRSYLLAVALVALLECFAPRHGAAALAVNSTLIMRYHNRGYTFGQLNEHEFNTALIELASGRYVWGMPACPATAAIR